MILWLGKMNWKIVAGPASTTGRMKRLNGSAKTGIQIVTDAKPGTMTARVIVTRKGAEDEKESQ